MMVVDPKALDEFVRRNARVKARAQFALHDDPENIDVLCAVSALYDRMGDFAGAQAVADRAVATAPESAQAHIQRGVVLRHRGDFPAALEAHWRAVALDPLAARAYHELARMGGFSKGEDVLPMLTSVFERLKDEPYRALMVGHAIANVLEDRGDCEGSFDWLVRAKRGTGRLHPYDQSAAELLHEAGMQALGMSREGFASDEAIFIVGLPRTGTTLVDRILSSHPDVQSGGEMSNWPVLVNVVAGQQSAALTTATAINTAAAFDPVALGKSYLESTRPITGSRPHFTDKRPMNYQLAGIIRNALPNGRIVCLRRNPLDTCIGMFKQDLPVDQYSFISDIANCARYFVLFDRFVARCTEVLPADRFTVLEYETLVRNFEPETRRLVDFCGLAWDDRCLRFHENDAPVATPSGQQVRMPIYDGAIGRSRKYGEKLRPAREVFAAAGYADLD